MRLTDGPAIALWSFLEMAPAMHVHCLTAETCRALLTWNDPNGEFARLGAADARALLVAVVLGNRQER